MSRFTLNQSTIITEVKYNKQIREKVLIMSEKITEKKEDGRIRYTKMRIRSAFYELVKEMDHDKITVTAVCKKAEINRATFYKHYLDIPDLADKLQEEALHSLVSRLNVASTDDNIDDFIVDFLIHIRESLLSENGAGLFSIANSSSFISKISRLLYNKFYAIIEPKLPGASEMDKKMIFSYIAGGCAGLVDYWAKTGFKENEKDLAKKLRSISTVTINNIS